MGGLKDNLKAVMDKVSMKKIVVVCYKSLYCMKLVVSVKSKRLGLLINFTQFGLEP